MIGGIVDVLYPASSMFVILFYLTINATGSREASTMRITLKRR